MPIAPNLRCLEKRSFILLKHAIESDELIFMMGDTLRTQTYLLLQMTKLCSAIFPSRHFLNLWICDVQEFRKWRRLLNEI